MVSSEGRQHLLQNHRTRLAARFGGHIAGETCAGACGYEFSPEQDTDPAFVCPNCGYDNLRYFAGQFVWRSLDRR